MSSGSTSVTTKRERSTENQVRGLKTEMLKIRKQHNELVSRETETLRKAMALAREKLCVSFVKTMEKFSDKIPKTLGSITLLRILDGVGYKIVFANGTVFYVAYGKPAFCVMPNGEDTCMYDMSRHVFRLPTKSETPYYYMNNSECVEFFKWLMTDKFLDNGTKTLSNFIMQKTVEITKNPFKFLEDA